MKNYKRIDEFTKHLSRMLLRMDEASRTEIVAEIRSHLEIRAEEGRLDEAFSALGSPLSCARGFFDELKLQEAYVEGGVRNTIGALMSLASRRIWAAIGLFISAIFFTFSIGFALTAIVEVAAPEFAGLWVGNQPSNFIFGISSLNNSTGMTDILGSWLIPIAIATAVFTLVCGQWLGRYFVAKMAQRNSN